LIKKHLHNTKRRSLILMSRNRQLLSFLQSDIFNFCIWNFCLKSTITVDKSFFPLLKRRTKASITPLFLSASSVK
jgi:hypothetical protein